MEHESDQEGKDPRYGEKERAQRRRMNIECLIAFGLYVGFCLYWIFFSDSSREATERGMRIAAVPLALFALSVCARWHFRCDEFERQIQRNGMAVGFFVAMATSLILGILGLVGSGAGAIAAWIIYTTGIVSFAIAVLAQKRRLSASQ